MGSPKVNMPATPDPANLAKVQGEQNLEAAIATSLLNQVNEVGPYGTVTYSMAQPQSPAMPFTRPNFGGMLNRGDFGEQGINLPRFNSGMPAAQGGYNIDGLNIPQVTRTVNLTPEAQAQLDAQMATSRALSDLAQENIGRVQQAQRAGFDLEGLPNAVYGIDAPMIQAGLREYNPMEGFDTSYLQGVEVQPVQGLMGIGMQGLPELGTDYADQGALLEQASFDRARSLLEPQFSRQMGQAEVRLSERGLPLSSQLGQEAIGGVSTAQNRALKEAALDAVFAGRQEQQRLANLAMAQRGQLFGERAQSIDTANRAGQQLFGQQMGLRGQQFGEAFDQANFANQARAQAFAQALSGGQFRNQAQQQAFNQAAANAALQNAARQQGIQERAYMRNIPLNDVSALMGTAGGVQLPQFQALPNVAVQAPDYMGAALGVAGLQNQQAQMQQQAKSGFLSGLMGLGGSLGQAAILASDVRVKENIKRVGKFKGHNLYEYNYKGMKDRVLGVMAQEIERIIPEAIVEMFGIKHVNYGAI